jgi:uncharacterized repeat protein (TIGR03843 family)
MTLEILGRMMNASNSTIVVRDDEGQYIYKPISGERPLWDFPDGTLAARECAAFVLSNLAGWSVVPSTQLREGPMGEGSFQEWVEADVTSVDVIAPSQVPSEWHLVTTGVDEAGREVALAHAPDDGLRRIALFDAVINNADRKGGHILTNDDGVHFAIDHGVTFHSEPKLRTVLWGWIGQPFTSEEIVLLEKTLAISDDEELATLLSAQEITALKDRVRGLLDLGTFPEPSPHWPSIPWPVF